MKILILANNDVGLYKFRKELLEELLKTHEVYISLPNGDFVKDMIAMGCQFVETDFSRHGTNPVSELKLFLSYKRMLKEIKPGIVFTYTIKPNVYGGIACQALKIPYVANITGLGTAVENPGLMQKMILFLYRKGLKGAQKVFFQNTENLEFMLGNKIIGGSHDLLPGSGVDLKNYLFERYPDDNGKLIFITVGRIMKDKGISELLHAAGTIKNKYPGVIFKLIGSFDEDYQTEVQKAHKDGIIEYLGQQQDVKPFYKECNAVIHASYHEGMSNVLLEASATGRPVIATNIPGCREIFDNGVSGISFKPKDANDLVRAIEVFIRLSHEQRAEMGKAARKKVQDQFSREIVIGKYLNELKGINQYESL